MKLRIVIILIICVFILPIACVKEEIAKPQVEAQPIKLKVSVSKPSVRIGDIIYYTIQVDAYSNLWFQMPSLAENLGGFAIHNWDKSEKEINIQGRAVQTQTYELETYLTGTYEIPPAKVLYVLNGKTNVISGTPICVDVVSVAEEGDIFSGIRDIKGPVDIISLVKSKMNLYLTVIACALLAALIVIFLVRKYKQRPKIAVPPTPAHIIAYAALHRLAERHLVENDAIKEYYYELSNILRHYIEDRFSLRAPERTTEEFLRELNEGDVFSIEHRLLLKKFLTESDLVKFANYSASRENACNAHDTAVDFIDATKAVESDNKSLLSGKETN